MESPSKTTHIYKINSRDIKFTQNGTDCSFSKIEYDIRTVSILAIIIYSYCVLTCLKIKRNTSSNSDSNHMNFIFFHLSQI